MTSVEDVRGNEPGFITSETEVDWAAARGTNSNSENRGAKKVGDGKADGDSRFSREAASVRRRARQEKRSLRRTYRILTIVSGGR